MVTNYPQQLAATGEMTEKAAESLTARLIGRIGQMLCGMRGHDSVLHFERKRVMMRCTSCGYDSPGWEISERGPRHRYDGDPRHHLLPQTRLVLRKSA